MQTHPLLLLLPLALAACGNGASPADATPGTDVVAADSTSPTDGALPADAAQSTDAPPADAPPAADTCRGNVESIWTADPRMCLVRYADGLARPRGLALAPSGELFVVANGAIVVLFDSNDDGRSDSTERAVFAMQPGLNHGLAFAPDGAYLYASTPDTVYRWPYRAGARAATGPAETVVTGIPGGGNHVTRTLLIDRAGRLYVSVGSAGNVDTDTGLTGTRSMIRRFALAGASLPMAYGTGTVVASGMRNEVGLLEDSMGRLWSVENGRDSLTDARFGGDVHNDNPAEELNRFDGTGPTYFGYPQCWTEGRTLANGGGAGSQHADTSADVPGAMQRTDAWCASATNVRAPAAAMPAHWAPLGLMEYTGAVLPAAWRGDLLITAHGSWNRESPTGRLIARAHLSATGAVLSVEPVVGEMDGAGNFRDGVWRVRPVDIRQGAEGAVYFTDDANGRVYRIGYRAP